MPDYTTTDPSDATDTPGIVTGFFQALTHDNKVPSGWTVSKLGQPNTGVWRIPLRHNAFSGPVMVYLEQNKKGWQISVNVPAAREEGDYASSGVDERGPVTGIDGIIGVDAATQVIAAEEVWRRAESARERHLAILEGVKLK